MDICIERDEVIKNGDPIHSLGVRFEDGGEKKIVCTHLSGSVVINGRFG